MQIPNISIKDIREAACTCEVLILPFTEGNPGLYNDLLPSAAKLIKKIFSREFTGKLNEVLLLVSPGDIKAERIVFLGLGKEKEITREKIRQAGGKATVYLKNMGMKKVALSSRILSSLGISPADFIEGSLLGLYTFNKYRKDPKARGLDSIIVLAKKTKKLSHDLAYVQITASSVNFSRDLINTPANEMTPSDLAHTALSLKRKKLSVRILDKQDMKKLHMGSFLSVAAGSTQPPQFIIFDYRGGRSAPVVIIGKSITFDSGGLSLKPADGMEKMKYDMAGGAAVLGIVKAVSELRLPVHLIGILPATENLPGGSATRPGDIVRALNGKTIEIISTDAEGRMTLADAIAYAKRFKPKAIIDIATLTGACAIALGNGAIAMMGNDRDLLDKMKKSGDETHERVWEMPLFEEYRDNIKGDISDLKNSGGKSGSLVSSAYFLYEFAGETPWVHLDIAGTAWVEKEKPYMPKGASGIGVRLILGIIRQLI